MDFFVYKIGVNIGFCSNSYIGVSEKFGDVVDILRVFRKTRSASVSKLVSGESLVLGDF